MSGAPEAALRAALARVEREGTYTAYMAASNALAAARGEASGSYRIALLRNFTVEPLLPVLEVELARSGLAPHTYLGDFDAVAADALNAKGGLARFDAHAIILALWLDGLSPALAERFASLGADGARAEIERLVAYVRQMLTGIRGFTQAPVLLNNFPLPIRPALGILDAQREDSPAEAVLTLNRSLRELAREIGNVFIVDYMSLFAAVGTAEGYDARKWVHRRSPLGRRALIPIGQEYAKFLRALSGKVRKCVVVDCDNTLWGGIIGEDGMDGIRLGENPAGSGYTGLQRELVSLHDRGVLIALCSKNNESDVFEVLRSHSDMLLKESHVAAHRINWEDKASNLRAIAAELNIGLDSLVFVDDSPFECGLVREQLPEIAVVELSADQPDLASQLARHCYFDSLVMSGEDKHRTAHFKAEATRRALRGSATTLDEYLERLEMVAEIGVAREELVPRLAQLTQKTNQFNLTTKRYTEADIRRFADSDESEVVYVRLRDNVADLGIIGMGILRYAGDTAEIDTLLMSCRALGRGVELVLLDEMRRHAAHRGCRTMRGLYIPTAKNAQVADFYPSAGFALEREEGPARHFVADAQSLPPVKTAIAIVRSPAPQPQTA